MALVAVSVFIMVVSFCPRGQADTIGIAMRRALLGEIKGTCITRAKSEKVSHEYSTIVGIEELVLTTILGHLHNIQRNRARGH